MIESIARLREGVIVSCQSEGDDPFNHPTSIAAFALAAEMGGAAGIRAQGFENIKAIRAAVHLPVIGIVKGAYGDGWVLITPDFDDIERVLDAGADIVAVDATHRVRPNGLDGILFLQQARRRYDMPFMADVSTPEEGIHAVEAGAEIVATTLSGYTPYTEEAADEFPDFNLIERLTAEVKVPVIAEGRIWSPSEASHAMKCGAYAVVVGTAITRPRVITQRFVEAIRKRG